MPQVEAYLNHSSPALCVRPISMRYTLPLPHLNENRQEHQGSDLSSGNGGHCRDAATAMRWIGAAMQEAAKGFRRLKAHTQLPILRGALFAIQMQHDADAAVAPEAVAG